jgi:hypothetical protein
MRLFRLWLWSAPVVMLAMALVFSAIAVDERKWGLLAVMVLLALVALALFEIQRRVMRRLR